MEYLTNIELYICSEINVDEIYFTLAGEEYHHAIKVMRHKAGHNIYVTDGAGKIIEGEIFEIGKEECKSKIINIFDYNNNLEKFTLCIPNLKNSERLKFAIEKSVELGFTNFIIFNSERTIAKNIHLNRLEKIAVEAMKQSLHSYLPKLVAANSLKEILNFGHRNIIFDQSSDNKINKNIFGDTEKYNLIFGPEGSFSESEIDLVNKDFIINLGKNRLRSETAVIKCASIISEIFDV